MSLTLLDINRIFEDFLKQLDREKYDVALIKKAYDFAKKAHAFQRRKSGDPYIIHPVEVTKIVYSFGLDTSSLISSLLHDVVEDTEVTLDEIAKEFGEEVKLIVDGLSKIKHFGDKKNDVNSDEHIETLRKILLASAKDIRILVIKLCDRLHNMRTLKELPEPKQVKKANETMQIYVPIAQKIGIYSLKWELEDLAFKFLNPDMFQYIKEKVGLKRKEREEIVEKIVAHIKKELKLTSKSETLVLGRPKNFYSIYKKIKDKAKNFEDIYDLYAIRIITKDIAQCYLALGLVHEKFKVVPNRLKDYIANPKANGYQSIHSVIFSPVINGPVEIQIRTDEMNKLAEFGVAAHWKYKNIKEDKRFEQKISWLREVLYWEKEHKDNHEFLKLLRFDFFENEIFVFTPKNDLITLPESATVLDFAYAVHTDIGDHAYKGKVNGQVTTLDKKLKSGDIVEIITNPNVKPSEKWLKFVKTSKARIKIRNSLHLKLPNAKGKRNEVSSTEGLLDKIERLKSFKSFKLAGCCTFEYGDQIVGILNKEKKLSIHHAGCSNAKYSLNTKIPLRWKEETSKEITLHLMFKDRHGIVMDLLSIFSEYNVHCTKLNTKVSKDGTVSMKVVLLDGPHISSVISKLEVLDSFVKVEVQKSFFDSFKS
jgi:GTP pyrophosphokinase